MNIQYISTRTICTCLMSKIVISQPMYLPWRGIFEQIRLCDIFVFYDDVQIPLGTHKTFITRVQIKTPLGWEWLSVPIQRSGKGQELIKESLFADRKWKRTHMVKLEQFYRAAPHFEEIYESIVRPIYAIDTDFFSAFAISAMRRICAYLGLEPRFFVSSELGLSVTKSASERVFNLCSHFGATEHITGHGALNYMDHDLFDSHGIATKYMVYGLTPYPQLHGPFTPYVSILDLLFNVGPAAPRYLDSEAVYWKDFVKLRRAPR